MAGHRITGYRNSAASAWQFDDASEQYYYHAFLAEQSDLNWRNPAVVDAMHDVMRFWLRKGVDGFRVDVIWHLIKDAQFRDNPENPGYVLGEPPNQRLVPLYTTDLPEVHNVIRGLRQVIDEFPERLLVGEIYLPLNRLVAYYGNDLEETHLPFNFPLLETQWHARDIAKLVDGYEAALPAGWLAKLGSWQSRSTSHLDASWFSASPYRSHAAADVARHAYNLLRR